VKSIYNPQDTGVARTKYNYLIHKTSTVAFFLSNTGIEPLGASPPNQSTRHMYGIKNERKSVNCHDQDQASGPSVREPFLHLDTKVDMDGFDGGVAEEKAAAL